MNPNEKLSLPFLTRKMLEFEHGVAFDLELRTVTVDSGILFIIGATREGMFKFRVAPAGDGSAESFFFRIPDIPIFVNVYGTDISVERGEQWVSLFLRAGEERIMRMGSGYISIQSALNWPIVQSESELSGGGKYNYTNGLNPAAGAECSITVPTSEHWIIKAFQVQLVTDATVAARVVQLSVALNGSPSRLKMHAPTTQAASLTRLYHYGVKGSVEDSSDDDDIFGNIYEDMHVKAGSTITTETTALQAGDNFGVPTVFYEQYIEL